MNEPQDARPKWMDPDAQDDVPAAAPFGNPFIRQMRREAQYAREQREATKQNYATADPEAMALNALIMADEGPWDHRQVHASRAAAWASLAVLRELRTHHRPR